MSRAALTAGQAWQEIQASRLAIEDRLGSQVRFFSYPYGAGAEDPALQAMVRDAGYQAAVAARPFRWANTADSDIWALPRMAIGQEHPVDLDPEREAYFFMRQVDPDFPLPSITIDAWRSQGGQGSAGHCFSAGQVVTIEVDITNRGQPAAIQVVLSLDDDADHDQVIFRQAADGQLDQDETATFTYDLLLAEELDQGPLQQAIQVMDSYGVLGFGGKDWATALLLAEDCHTVQLPIVGIPPAP